MDTPEQKHYTTRQLLIVLTIATVMGILFPLFFYDIAVGISVFIYMLIFSIGLIIFIHKSDRKPSLYVWIYLGLILFFSFMLFVFTSQMLTIINILMMIVLGILLMYIVSGVKLKDFTILSYIKAPIIAVANSVSGVIYFLSDIQYRFTNQNTKHNIFSQVVKGFFIALPFIVIFILLFSSADEVFGEIMNNIFSFDINQNTMTQIILGIVVGVLFLSYFAVLLRKNYNFENSSNDDKKKLTVIEGSIALGLINILFLIFILIQIVYLFGGDTNITEQGFTYAEYARRGFAELIFAGILTMIIIRAFETYIERKENRHSQIFTILSLLLTAQAIVMMISAFKRLALYEQAYGFTDDRLFAHGIIIWFGIMFVILAVKIFLHRQDTFFEQGAFISFVMFFIILNLMNPDAFIAQKNIERFEKTDKIDIYHIGRLSEDAIPVSAKLLDMNINNRDKSTLIRYFEIKKARLERDNMSNLLASNLSRDRAMKIFKTRNISSALDTSGDY